MAAILKLVRGSTEVNFVTGTDGIYVSDWVQEYSHEEGATEVITFSVSGTSTTNLASRVNAVATMIQQMRQRNLDQTAPEPTYLHAQLDGEPVKRQAFITGMQLSHNSTLMKPPTSTADFIPEATLSIARHPWESVSPQADAISLADTDGSITQNNDTKYGTVPGRISRSVIGGGAAGIIEKVWWGFRTDRYGTRANFVPAWACTAGTLNNNTSVTAATGDAMWQPAGGGDNDMLTRVTLNMSQITANHSEQRGRHLVLLRARAESAATRTFYVRLLDGLEYFDTDTYAIRDRIEVSENSKYKFYSLGYVNIPPIGIRDTTHDAHFSNYRMLVQAEEGASGSGGLYMTQLVLIPQSEGSGYADGCYIVGFGGDQWDLNVFTDADGRQFAYSTDGTYAEAVSDLQLNNYMMPIDQYSVVMAAESTIGQVTTHQVDFSLTYYPRWSMLTDGP